MHTCMCIAGRLGFRTKFRAQLRPRRIESLTEGAPLLHICICANNNNHHHHHDIFIISIINIY